MEPLAKKLMAGLYLVVVASACATGRATPTPVAPNPEPTGSAEDWTDDKPRTGRAALELFINFCPAGFEAAMGQPPVLSMTKEQLARGCQCVQRELERALDLDRQYTPAEFEAIFQPRMASCLAPEARRSFTALCLEKVRASAAGTGAFDDRSLRHCECLANVVATALANGSLSSASARADFAANAASRRADCLEQARSGQPQERP